MAKKSQPKHAAPKHAAASPKKAQSAAIDFPFVKVTAFIILIVCIVILGKYVYEIIQAKKNHTDLKDLYNSHRSEQAAEVTIPSPDEMTATVTAATTVEDEVIGYEEFPDETAATLPETTTAETTPAPRPVMAAAQALLDINTDTVGYVNIPGCVDEPVVKGKDNDWYLTHNFYGQERQCGTCFADYRDVVGDHERSDNVVLYAHDQKDGTMFGCLKWYRNNVYYWKENPFIYFSTNYEDETYVIVSAFIVNALPEHDNGNIFDYNNYIDFADEGKYSFETFSKEIYERSHFHTGIDIAEDDAYLTLSTCAYDWDEPRLVIVARRLRDGETTDSIDLTGFEKNDNIKWPAIWYKYNGGSYNG
ncbi:MAG: class B sortase [Oscillospiraceae bacterium]|nr:class B sortase [Oscillospiraceae bacterium]